MKRRLVLIALTLTCVAVVVVTDLSNVVGRTLRPTTASMWLREDPS